MKLQIHTVLLTNSKRQGLAMGIDIKTGKTFRIWLLNDRAVNEAMKRLEAVARGFKATPKRISSVTGRHRLGSYSFEGGPRTDREWALR